MAELKTKLNNASVDEFIKSFKDERVQADYSRIIRMMKKAAKAEPKMWGTSIVGFGTRHLDQIVAKSVKATKTAKA